MGGWKVLTGEGMKLPRHDYKGGGGGGEVFGSELKAIAKTLLGGRVRLTASFERGTKSRKRQRGDVTESQAGTTEGGGSGMGRDCL